MAKKNEDPQELTIDKEFAELCRPLTAEECAELRESLADDGLRDPIITWANHADTIVDGHNRYRECKTLDIPIRTKPMFFEDRLAVVRWIVKNQCGRRNCSETEKSYLRGKQAAAEKKAHGDADRLKLAKNAEKSPSGQNVHLGKTAERIAEQHGVNEKTIRRDEEFAAATDAVTAKAPELRSAVLTGKIDKKDTVALASAPKEVLQKVAQAENPKQAAKEAVKEAAKKDGDKADKDPRIEASRKGREALGKLEESVKALGLTAAYGETLDEIKEKLASKLPAAKTGPMTSEERMAEHNRPLNALSVRLAATIKEAEALDAPHLSVEGVKSHLRAASGELRAAKAHAVCCYCEKAKPSPSPACKWCKGSGWLTKTQYESSPAIARK